MTEGVFGISEVDFQAWKHHPVSKVYLAFLSDYADVLARAMLDEFLIKGEIATVRSQEIRGRIIAAKEASELEFGAIAEFYRQEEENAAEANQN